MAAGLPVECQVAGCWQPRQRGLVHGHAEGVLQEPQVGAGLPAGPREADSRETLRGWGQVLEHMPGVVGHAHWAVEVWRLGHREGASLKHHT